MVTPVSAEELRAFHASITTDVRALHAGLDELTGAVRDLAAVVAPSLPPSHSPPNSGVPQPRAAVPLNSILHPPAPAGTPLLPRLAPRLPIPQVQRPSRRMIPTAGLVIPNVPVLRPDGTRRPRKESWRDVVKHWTTGDPALGLHTPLEDWPAEWIQGNNRIFATKRHERSVIALEFINTYHSDEASFLAAYPQAGLGHTALLHAINTARRERGERESRGPRRARRQADGSTNTCIATTSIGQSPAATMFTS